jgi:hypothetical protein
LLTVVLFCSLQTRTHNPAPPPVGLLPLFAYIVGKRRPIRILYGYQYKEAEFRAGDLTTDFSFQGPMAGFNFRF